MLLTLTLICAVHSVWQVECIHVFRWKRLTGGEFIFTCIQYNLSATCPPTTVPARCVSNTCSGLMCIQIKHVKGRFVVSKLRVLWKINHSFVSIFCVTSPIASYIKKQLDLLTKTLWHMSCSLLWRHNGHDSVSNHQPYDCLLNRLFRRRSKKTSNSASLAFVPVNAPRQ